MLPLSADAKEWVLSMARLTTNREWCNFLWNNVQPAVKVANLHVDWPCVDVDDNDTPWEGRINFRPPGTERPNKPGTEDHQKWRKMWNGC